MQNSLSSGNIIRYLKENMEPLEDNIYGVGYRASVYLNDGTYLPCVIFRNPSKKVSLALKRFKEVKCGRYNIVRGFVVSGNCINHDHVAKIERSPYAFPLHIQKQIDGETSMGWTGFTAKMNDGKYIGFGTTCNTEFFEIPPEYSVNDIVEIINHSYVLNTGELKYHRLPNNDVKVFRGDDYKSAIIYREKPFFECYLDNL